MEDDDDSRVAHLNGLPRTDVPLNLSNVLLNGNPPPPPGKLRRQIGRSNRVAHNEQTVQYVSNLVIGNTLRKKGGSRLGTRSATPEVLRSTMISAVQAGDSIHRSISPLMRSVRGATPMPTSTSNDLSVVTASRLTTISDPAHDPKALQLFPVENHENDGTINAMLESCQQHTSLSRNFREKLLCQSGAFATEGRTPPAAWHQERADYSNRIAVERRGDAMFKFMRSTSGIHRPPTPSVLQQQQEAADGILPPVTQSRSQTPTDPGSSAEAIIRNLQQYWETKPKLRQELTDYHSTHAHSQGAPGAAIYASPSMQFDAQTRSSLGITRALCDQDKQKKAARNESVARRARTNAERVNHVITEQTIKTETRDRANLAKRSLAQKSVEAQLQLSSVKTPPIAKAQCEQFFASDL